MNKSVWLSIYIQELHFILLSGYHFRNQVVNRFKILNQINFIYRLIFAGSGL